MSACAQQQVQQMEPTAMDFGDSISLGYAAHARLDLYRKVDFRHDAWDRENIQPSNTNSYFFTAVANGRNNGYSITLLAAMEAQLKGQNYTVILYNSGVHDLQHDPARVGAVRVDATTYR